MTQPGLKPTIYHTQEEHANRKYYTHDDVQFHWIPMLIVIPISTERYVMVTIPILITNKKTKKSIMTVIISTFNDSCS